MACHNAVCASGLGLASGARAGAGPRGWRWMVQGGLARGGRSSAEVAFALHVTPTVVSRTRSTELAS